MLLLRKSFNWSLTRDSKTLTRIDNLEIGLSLFKIEGSPPFNRGTTKADFQMEGITFVFKYRFKILVKGTAIQFAACFKKQRSRLSGPADVVMSKCLRALFTSETVIRLKLKDWLERSQPTVSTIEEHSCWLLSYSNKNQRLWNVHWNSRSCLKAFTVFWQWFDSFPKFWWIIQIMSGLRKKISGFSDFLHYAISWKPASQSSDQIFMPHCAHEGYLLNQEKTKHCFGL